ncbi:MAG: AraC family transcriptional regulator [Verrucomicrobiota bacterium]|jgi:AraC-like DNA-binding protein
MNTTENVAAGPPGQRPAFLSTQVSEAHRFFLNLTPRATPRLEVVCGGVERCRPDYVIQRTSFPYAALEFVAQGEGELKLRGRRFRLRPGMAFAYGPRVSHTIRTSAQSPMLKYYVDFVGREGDRLLAEGPLGRWEPVQVSSPNELTELFESLQRNGAAENPLTGRICSTLVALILLKIAERAIDYGAAESRALPTYERARRHLEAHYEQLKTVEEIARACHVNAAYLCRLFQRFDHRSPYQLLLRLKMNRAAALLLDGGLMVKEVAARLNFADPYHFSRVFKRVYGVSPDRFVKLGNRRGQPPA